MSVVHPYKEHPVPERHRVLWCSFEQECECGEAQLQFWGEWLAIPEWLGCGFDKA